MASASLPALQQLDDGERDGGEQLGAADGDGDSSAPK